MKKYFIFLFFLFTFKAYSQFKSSIGFNPTRLIAVNIPDRYPSKEGLPLKLLATYKKNIFQDINIGISTSLFYYEHKYIMSRYNSNIETILDDEIIYKKEIRYKGTSYGVRAGMFYKTLGQDFNLTFGLDISLLNRRMQERYKETFSNGDDGVNCGPNIDYANDPLYKSGSVKNRLHYGAVPNMSLNFRLSKHIWLEFPIEIQVLWEKNLANQKVTRINSLSWLSTINYYF